MTRNDRNTAGSRPQGWKRRLAMVAGGISILAVCLVIRHFWGAPAASAEPAAESAEAAPAERPAARAGTTDPSELKVVATVNGEDVTREELAQECLRHYGKSVLESLVNKYLIVLECQRRGAAVSQEEVNGEIERVAKRFGMPIEQWLKMLKQERGIKASQYASDIIWPTLALKKLAGQRLQISAEEVQAEYETVYGPAIKARLIACQDPQKAEKVRAEAAANPAEFGNLAKQYSEDAGSASLKGVVQPIRRHSGAKEIEDAAFRMKNGEVSPVLPVAGQFVILLREEMVAARDVPLEKVKAQLEDLVRDRKLREVSAEVFRDLQKNADVKNIFNDPVQSKQMPGVAALINGNQVSLADLAERCIERHGEDVLQGIINRRLLEQAIRKNRLTVTDADLDQEVARAAAAMIKSKPDGTPDVETWLKMVTQQQGVSVELYRHDAVWPSVALKKLVGDKVTVSQEDIDRGFEANYGPRVACMAILLDNLRRAQQAWEMARQDPRPELFGKLAEQYSCDATNRAMRGEIPPIQKHGGQPILEDEAFKLKPGELSSIIHLGGERYVILLCQGQTKPKEVDRTAAKQIIVEDIQEKKLRLAMADTFQQLQNSASVDNFLAGTSRSPQTAQAASRNPAQSSATATAGRAGSVLQRPTQR